jgi:hypothetical protein
LAAGKGIALDGQVYVRLHYSHYGSDGHVDDVRVLGGVQPPAIVVQPQSQTVMPGSDVTFSVAATGTGLSYQWQYNEDSLAGATNSEITLYGAQAINAGTYSVIVSNILTSLISSNATLTVIKLRVAPIPGMISWWRAEGNAVDEIGYNDGAMVNSVAFTNAIVGRGFAFSGGSDYVRLPQNLFPFPDTGTGNTPFSLELWFKTSAGGVILGQQNGAPFGSLTSYVPALYVGTDGKLYAQLFWKGYIDQVVSATAVNNGSFHHVAVTYDGTNEVVYLDGLAVGSKPLTQQAYAGGTYQYQFGTGYTPSWPAGNGGWYSFAGVLDEPAFYSRALTAGEVAAIYGTGALGKSAPTLRSADQSEDGRFQFTLTAEPGSLFAIQASTNLMNWASIEVVTIPVTGVTNIVDPYATNYIRRFYRAVQLDSSLITSRLSNPKWLGGGQVEFQVAGLVGSTQVIQASSNLTVWTPIATNVIPGSGALLFTDPDATNYSRRFYRALQRP